MLAEGAIQILVNNAEGLESRIKEALVYVLEGR